MDVGLPFFLQSLKWLFTSDRRLQPESATIGSKIQGHPHIWDSGCLEVLGTYGVKTLDVQYIPC